jgi:cell division protein ZapA (FtsZ GTPase activity inhibitor)
MTRATTVTITIQGNQYDLKCPEGQVDKLKSAAETVHKKLGEVKAKNVHGEKAAILTALNLAHELVECNSTCAELSALENPIATEQISNIINGMCDSIDSFLTKKEK